MTWRFDYRRWDGTQNSEVDDTDAVLAQLTDDLLANGDLHEALQRMLNRGWRTPDGQEVQGLRDLLDQLRLEREDQLDRGDLGGAYSEVAAELEEVLAEERGGIDQLESDARESGDQRRQEVTDEVATERRMALDLLPSDLAGKVRGLQQYEFVSSEARQHFEELMERLREEVARSYFDQMSEALANPDPEQLARMRDAFDALNRMLEQREAGEPIDPSFESFMENYGDLFPGNPANLDELLEQLAARMAAAQAMWNSMSPAQRAQLQGLAESLLEDMDLRWQVDRLAGNLQKAFPDAGWEQRYKFSGDQPLGMGDATDAASRLRDIDELEAFLRSANSPAALSEVDLDKVAKHLGEDAARSMDRLAKLAKQLADAGLIDQREGRFELTPAGMRRIGHQALADLFDQLNKDRIGNHRTTYTGTGHDREETTKPYEFGDPFNLDLSRTVHNAVRRSGTGVPVRLVPDDFEVIETEALSRTATVLLLDLSLSMPMRDNFVPAKKMALALHTLITTRFPRDYLGLVGFSEVARVIEPEDLPTVSWDYVYGTNLQHGLILARKMLAHQPGTKQIILVTDGEPTAHIIPYDRGVGYDVYFNYPPVPETLEVTLSEVMHCTKANITINTFLLDPDRALRGFIEQLTRINRGRTFSTSPDELGDYVLVDFLRHKTTLRSRGRRAG
ncbi:MAG TPA: VWA domain-containing protein [Acidimicrobiales bacterium]